MTDDPLGPGKRHERAARIAAVESAVANLQRARAEVKDWQTAQDHAFWEAQRAGVEIRLLAILSGLSVQAIYQAIDRAKQHEADE